MKQEKFLNLFFNRCDTCDTIVTGKNCGSIFHRNDIQNLKKLTSLMDYDCRFNKKGVCKHNKGSNNIMCCCGGCKGSIGYLLVIPYEDIKIYAEKFDEETGFWRTDGCSLPREFRSGVCLGHHCKTKLTDAELDLIDLLWDYPLNRRSKCVNDYINKYRDGLPEYPTLKDVIDHLKSRLEDK
jgi:hypothetical protein